MKEYKPLTDTSEIKPLFQKILEEENGVCIWQPVQENKQKKKQFSLQLIEMSPDFVLKFKRTNSGQMNFSKESIFFYCESCWTIWKSQVSTEEGEEIVCLKPESVIVMTKEEWERVLMLMRKGSVYISQDKQEEVFDDLRESPRGRPEIAKLVKVLIKKGNSTKERSFELFDLSRGGVGILTEAVDVFTQGQKIEITQIKEETFDPPLLAEVMRVHTHNIETKTYKVGLSFQEN